MFYSGYLSIYLLQSLNLDVSETQLLQETYTNMDYLLEDTLFPEDGPVFMQRVHEFHHPVAISSEEKIQRRLGVSNVPGAKATFKDGLMNDPNYWRKNPIASEIPIIKLYDTSVFVPHFDVNSHTKENTIQTQNEPLANEYEEYYATMGTTVKNVEGTPNDKTGVHTVKIDEASPPAEIPNMVNEPNVPMIPKTFDDYYPTGSKSPDQILDDPLMAGPGLNPRDDINPIGKNIDRYNYLLSEPTFFTQNFDVTQQRPTTKIRRVYSYDTSLMTKIANFFYPEMETTTELRLGVRTGEAGVFFIKRSNISTSKTKIEKLVGFQKLRPGSVIKSHNNMKDTTTRGLTRSILNEVSFMREQLNSKTKDTIMNKIKETLRNKTDFVQNYDVDFTKKVTKSQTFQEIIIKPTFDGPLKKSPEYKPKFNQGYPKTLGTLDFIHNDDINSHDLNSIITETESQIARETRKHTPLKKEINVIYPQKSKTTIKILNQPSRNDQRYKPNLDEVSYTQRFDDPISPIITKLFRAQSLTSAPLMSYVNSLHNPSFPSNLASNYPEQHETDLTVPNLALSSNERPDVTQKVSPESANISESMQTWVPITIVYNYRPPTTVVKNYDTVPEMRVHMPELTPMDQKTYTIIKAKPTHYGFMTERLPNQEQIRPERFESKDYRAITERLEVEKDAEEWDKNGEEDEGIPKQEQIGAENFESKDNQAITERLEVEKDAEEWANNGEEGEGIPKQEPFGAEIFESKDSQAITERLELEKDTKEPAENGEESEETVPFSAFLTKLMKVLASKNLRDLQFLIKAFESYVKTLVDSEKLTKLGAATGSFIIMSTGALRAPVKEIQRYLLIAHLYLENRHQMLDAGTIEMLNEIDDVYDVSEEEAMQRILHEITLFPNSSRNEEQIIKDFVDDIFLQPADRVAGTSKGIIVFEHIAKFAEMHMSTVSEYSRRNQKHEGDIVKDISFGQDEDLVKDHRRYNEGKFSSKIDFTTRSKRKRQRKMVIDLDSSDSRKLDSDDKSGVVIRIRINREKHSKAKSNNSGKIKKKRFGRYDVNHSTFS